MKNNRRTFIKKSASLAAVVSVTGLSACTGSGKKETALINLKSGKKDIDWPFVFGQDKPRMCLISSLDRGYMRKLKQIGIDYILCGGPQIPWTKKPARHNEPV